MKKTVKRIFAFALVLVMAVALYSCKDNKEDPSKAPDDGKKPTPEAVLWDGVIAEKYSEGEGTAEKPFVIMNGGELALLGKEVNGGKDMTGVYFVLGNDIIINDITLSSRWTADESPANYWSSIGYSYGKFCGSFDGCGHTVSGLYISVTGDSGGLFGVAGKGSDIRNFTISNSVIAGRNYCAAAVGVSEGTVFGITTTDTVRILGNRKSGGIVGNAFGVVTHCTNNASVVADSFAGGIVGESSGEIYDCVNNGAVTVKEFAGGIVGVSSGSVKNCLNTGKILPDGSVDAIVADNMGTLENCYYVKGSAMFGSFSKSVTEDDAKKQETFAGFDFDNIWKMGEKAPELK